MIPALRSFASLWAEICCGKTGGFSSISRDSNSYRVVKRTEIVRTEYLIPEERGDRARAEAKSSAAAAQRPHDDEHSQHENDRVRVEAKSFAPAAQRSHDDEHSQQEFGERRHSLDEVLFPPLRPAAQSEERLERQERQEAFGRQNSYVMLDEDSMAKDDDLQLERADVVAETKVADETSTRAATASRKSPGRFLGDPKVHEESEALSMGATASTRSKVRFTDDAATEEEADDKPMMPTASKRSMVRFTDSADEEGDDSHQSASSRDPALKRVQSLVSSHRQDRMASKSSAIRHHATVKSLKSVKDAVAGVAEEGFSGEMLQAVSEANIALVRLLLASENKEKHLNETDAEGINPLIVAVAMNNVEIVRVLLEGGADANTTDGEGVNALQVAAFDGYAGVARLLIQHGAEVDRVDAYGCTALYLAVGNSDVDVEEIVEVLLANGADPRAKADDGSTPIDIAATTRIRELLIKSGRRSKESVGRTQTSHRVQKLRNVASMFQGMVEFNKEVKGARHDNKVLRSPSKVREMREGRDAEDMNNALHTAVLYGKAEVVRKLCQGMIEDVDKPNGKDLSALQLAAIGGRTEVIEILLKAKADHAVVDDEGRTAIYLASRQGHLDVVSLLCSYKADVNLPDDDGETPVITACTGGFPIVAKALVNAKSDMNARNIQGRTALHISAASTKVKAVVQTALVDYLLKARASITITDNNGLTALEVVQAQPQANPDVLEMLQDAVAAS